MKKTIKCIVAVLMLIFIAMTVCACSSRDAANTLTEKEGVAEELIEKQAEDFDINLPPQEDRIKADLLENNENVFFIGGGNEALDIKSIEVTKRTDGLPEKVHVTAYYENQLYGAEEEYTLMYGFHDVGGWYLEDYHTDRSEIYAVSSITSEEKLLERYGKYFDTIEVAEHIVNTDGKKIKGEQYILEGTIEYPYMTEEFTVVYNMDFYENAWYETKTITNNSDKDKEVYIQHLLNDTKCGEDGKNLPMTKIS